ncbi:MAG TPA: histidinol dehydrogenase, partial [Candidatus Methanomethylicus sp.]|nr:histidinol dehydrogenase [Candidatus Methanomethylicus sp.]
MIITDINYLSSKQQGIPDEVIAVVKGIVSDVKERGDEAVLEYTEKFDRVRIDKSELKVGWQEMRRAYGATPESLRSALKAASDRIRAFQEMQLPEDRAIETAPGVSAGVKHDPISSVGIYVPGGSAAYPSTVLMTAMPAKVAKVGRVALFTPPGRDGRIPDSILAAAYLAEVDEVFKAGGAQAIAAMAYGTGTIRRVEKIVGPGNIYVTAAKMLVSWDVSIDMPAGPSEVMIYAEGVQRADWVALDVLAQAEHDPRARAIVVTANRVFAEALKAEVERMAVGSPRREILERSLQNAAILVVADRQEAIKAINMMAPEHLQIVGDDLEEMVAQVRNAGAVFIGETTPVALGDYSVGTNHVLPTMGWAKRASPLSVRDFLRTREYIRCTKEGLGSIANDAVIIATAEGLLNHARSVSAR